MLCGVERNDVTCYYELAVEKLAMENYIIFLLSMEHNNVPRISLKGDVNPGCIIIHVRK